ncbi:glucose/arabinose dehydrogenase [Nocardioides ginsengisegetis]|uniref:Glucose/arabinose dehydrogenase n=1 Tax=Nocardioides ginsengisegetis TaxID=661491 RepID=A0A7W3IY89_9ACTN|nr:PQQ-dependent sugar dehydrogenase [Nocardioides ginsengisegetis]MBA8802855.1 glucose/arabinose dehydrogenase [Nocardioides ginsengisegetis]
MRILLGALALALLVPAAPAAANRGPGGLQPPVPASVLDQMALTQFKHDRAAARSVPTLHVRKQVTGLDHPWDVQSIGHGRLLFTQRDRATLSVWQDGKTRTVKFPSDQVWVSGETGLMSLAIDPDFDRNGRFYLCQGGFRSGGGHDVRVIAWRLNDAATRATKIKKLIGGFPTSSGRHGGCRVMITRNGSLLVGTGDAAIGTNPEDKHSLGGKTLRLDRKTGDPWPTNPFIHAANKRQRYIQTYGHRNVQGLAERRDGSLWNVEQGTYRDDEVNKLVNGGDYGYNPVPGYNEDVPMTDQSLPGKQIEARWSSGDPTLATSGGSFVYGKKWGVLNGTLAVAVLKSTRVVFMTFDASGKLVRTRTPDALRHHGRLRSLTEAPNGDLLITTDNGDGNDAILRVTPS